MSYFFNNEPLSVLQMLSIVSSLLGVVFIAQPQLLVPSLRDGSETLDRRAEEYPHYVTGVVITLLGSLASGIAYLSMRKLGTGISSVVTTFYFGALSVPLCFICSLAMGDEVHGPVTGGAILLLSLVGLFGWIAQEGVSKAVGMAPAARMAPINYL